MQHEIVRLGSLRCLRSCGINTAPRFGGAHGLRNDTKVILPFHARNALELLDTPTIADPLPTSASWERESTAGLVVVSNAPHAEAALDLPIRE